MAQQCRQAWKVEKWAGREILGGRMGGAGSSVNLCGLKNEQMCPPEAWLALAPGQAAQAQVLPQAGMG